MPQGKGHVVKLVHVSRFDGGCDDSGVDSDFPCSSVPGVVGDSGVAAGLQDVTEAVVVDEHHGDAAC